MSGGTHAPVDGWSDGTGFWLLPSGNAFLFGVSGDAQDFSLDSTNGSPAAVWSDGERLWVLNNNSGSAKRIHVYLWPDGYVTPTAPSFIDDAGADRTAMEVSLGEDAVDGSAVDVRVRARDLDGNITSYSITGGANKDSFVIDSHTGLITVASGQAAGLGLDFETDRNRTFVVVVSVTDGREADGAREDTPTVDDTITVTVKVADVDEAGTVSVDAAPSVGSEVVATVTDPDGDPTPTSWEWASAATELAADHADWAAIASADSARYTPVAADEGKWLRVTAVYEDVTFSAEATVRAVVGPVAADSRDPQPAFTDSDNDGTADPVSRSLAERIKVYGGAAVGPMARFDLQAGAPVAAVAGDADTLTYILEASGDSELFTIDSASGQVSAADLDDFPSFESPADTDADNVYELVVAVSDNKDINGDPDPTVDDTVMVRVTVTDEAEPANVALSYSDPWAGVTLVAGLADDDYSGDASVPDTTWTWERSANGTSDWETAPGTVTDGANLTSAYMPTDDDIGWYLRATANDANLVALPPDSPLDDSLTATTTAAVTAAPECTTPANLVDTILADPDDTNSVATPGELRGIRPAAVWSDGRTMWVASRVRVRADESLSYPVTAFGLCDGTRDASQPQQYSTVSGANRVVWGMWAEGSTIWTTTSVDHALSAFTMTPQRGWVRQSEDDYEASTSSSQGPS